MNSRISKIFLTCLVGLILCAAFCLPTLGQQAEVSPTPPEPSSKKQAKLPFAIRDNSLMSSVNVANYQKVAIDYETQRTIELRNRLIFMAVSQIDLHFRSNERKVRHRNRLFQTVINILEVGAATAISITNGERAKTIIADGLGFIQGSRDSINKNYKMVERQVLVNKMVEKRAKVLATIYERVDLSDEKYPFERAFIDLLDYFEAGRLDSALSELAKDSGSSAVNAEKALNDAKIKADIRLSSSSDQIRVSKANSKIVQAVANSENAAVEKIGAADKTITAADKIINDQNSTAEQKEKAQQDKTKAEADRKTAQDEQTAAMGKYKKIFKALEAEPKLSVILDELPEAYPKLAKKIEERLERIRGGSGTPEDYGLTLLKFYGRITELVGTDAEVVEKATKILEDATKEE